jgi:hypothetical protein
MKTPSFAPRSSSGSARSLASGVAALLVIASIGVASPSFADGDSTGRWEPVRNEQGIVVSRKAVPGSAFVALRGEGDVDAPLLLVGSVLVDITRDKEWVDHVVEARVLRAVGETEYVTYSHVGTPVTMSDRDFVTDVVLSVDPSSRTLAIRMHSVNEPTAPRTHYVRGELTESSFVLTSIDGGKRTHVVAEIHCDPKGSIAPWIVNMFQKDWGYNTLTSLRAQVKKPDIAVHPRLKSVLEERGFFE